MLGVVGDMKSTECHSHFTMDVFKVRQMLRDEILCNNLLSNENECDYVNLDNYVLTLTYVHIMAKW